MTERAVVTNTAHIDAPPSAVWAALTEPSRIARWQSGARVETTWEPGSPLLISGMIGRKKYRDRGKVLRVEPGRLLEYEWLSRISGLPDEPQNYSVLTYSLAPERDGTRLEVNHAVPPSPIRRGNGWVIGPESGLKHVEFWWRSTLPIFKAVAEGKPHIGIHAAE